MAGGSIGQKEAGTKQCKGCCPYLGVNHKTHTCNECAQPFKGGLGNTHLPTCERYKEGLDITP